MPINYFLLGALETTFSLMAKLDGRTIREGKTNFTFLKELNFRA